MPIYEYECAQCGIFEKEQSMSDDPLKRCPKCRKKVTKLISASSFHLKGGGWYADSYDSKGGASNSDSGSSSTTGSTAAATAGASTESKSSTKSKKPAKGGSKKSSGKSSAKSTASSSSAAS